MGLTTGFIGGFTLASAVYYLTISLHQKNRATQGTLLRQQRLVLLNLIERPPPPPDAISREISAGLLEMAKDKWNHELEKVVRTAYSTDWRRVREDAEDRVSGMVKKIRENK